MSEFIPGNLQYAKTHEWVRVEDGEVVVGLSAYAVEQMEKEIVNVDLPQPGAKVEKGGSFGVVDSIKSAFDIYSPVSGEVTKVNSPVLEKPEIVAESPYQNGWLVRIRMNNRDDLNDLMNAAQYEEFLKSSE